MDINNKKLFRSRDNKMLAGVCAGFAQYLNVDVTILRVILVLVTIFGGSGLLIYFIFWIIIPEEPQAVNPQN